jgi:hypothetical protein
MRASFYIAAANAVESAPVQGKQAVQMVALATVQAEPTGQKQPALAPYQISRSSSFAEELGSPHLIRRLAGMLQNVRPVVDDPALWHPLLQTLSEWFPHVQTSGSNRTSLKLAQILLEKLV